MKNLLTILLLLTIGTATAQDGLNQTPEYYKDIQKKTINISADKVAQMGYQGEPYAILYQKIRHMGGLGNS